MFRLKPVKEVAEMQRTIDAYERCIDELAANAALPENARLIPINHPKKAQARLVFDFITFVAEDYPEVIAAWHNTKQ